MKKMGTYLSVGSSSVHYGCQYVTITTHAGYKKPLSTSLKKSLEVNTNAKKVGGVYVISLHFSGLFVCLSVCLSFGL